MTGQAHTNRSSAIKAMPYLEPESYWSGDQYKKMDKRYFMAVVSSPDFRFAYPETAACLQARIEQKLKGVRRVYDEPIGPKESERPIFEWPPVYRGARICWTSTPPIIWNAESPDVTRYISGRCIIERVCKFWRVSKTDLISARRTQNIAWPRQVACWLMKRHTTLSLPQMGALLGNRDHTTALHGIRKVDAYLDALKAKGGKPPKWACDGFMEAAE